MLLYVILTRVHSLVKVICLVYGLVIEKHMESVALQAEIILKRFCIHPLSALK